MAGVRKDDPAGELHAPVRQRKQPERDQLQHGGDRDQIDQCRQRPPPESAALKFDAVIGSGKFKPRIRFSDRTTRHPAPPDSI
jgi:hypothetical protein